MLPENTIINILKMLIEIRKGFKMTKLIAL